MSRRKVLKSYKREVKGDPAYNDKLIGKFVNILMERGKKSIAQKVLYKAFDIIEKETKTNPVEVFRKAIEGLKIFIKRAGRFQETSGVPWFSIFSPKDIGL